MKITATLSGGDSPRTYNLDGRLGQTLYQLHRSGPAGVTALNAPAKRLAAYVHSLRKLGFTITTEREPHGGDYPGFHARYRLQCEVALDLQGTEPRP